MKFDLVYLLVDYGGEDGAWLKMATGEMIRSARRAFKDHEMRVVQLSDRATPVHPAADGAFVPELDRCPKEQLVQFRGYFTADYALRADRPVIFCDVDLIWNRAAPELINPDRVIVLGRDDIPCMPYNTGIIATPPHVEDFWTFYQRASDSLPVEIQGWWGDQIALTAAVGACRHLVTGYPMDQIAPAIDTLPEKPLETAAVHFKGMTRKNLLVPYARMLDGSHAFDWMAPSEMNRVSRAQERKATEWVF